MGTRNKKKLPFFEEVLINDAGSNGKAVAKVNERVVFVTGAVPGDVVDLRVIKKRKAWMEAVPTRFHSYSDKRTEAFCSHFGTCGGCKWQSLKYEEQLFYKQKEVKEAFTRIGKLEFPKISTIIPSENRQYYRNKLEFTFSDKGWLTQEEIANDQSFNRDALGFHIPGRFDRVLDIEHCYLQENPSNEIRLAVKEYAVKNQLEFFNLREGRGFLRNLLIRSTASGEWMVILSFFRNDEQEIKKIMEHLAQRFPKLTSLMYVVNPKGNDTIFDLEISLYKGRDHIIEEMPLPGSNKVLKFKIGPKSFFQTNSHQALILYNTVKEMAGLSGKELVYDLYTGIGTIANFVADSVRKVIGVEYIPEAIEDAKANSRLNGITNTGFFAGDLKDVLNDDFIEKEGRPEVIITDPPRAGMHQNVTETLLKMAAEKIVYVSCNPATQARDLALLSDSYRIEKVQPVDMFPHTHHVENVVLLHIKG